MFKELNCDKHFSLILEDWKKEGPNPQNYILGEKIVFFIIKSFVEIVPIKLIFNSSSLSFYITGYQQRSEEVRF